MYILISITTTSIIPGNPPQTLADKHYTWDEETARKKIDKEITNKLGTTSNWFNWLLLSLFLSDNEIKKEEEIHEIKDIAEEEINSPCNYKRVVVKVSPQRPYRYQRKKRWNENRLKNRLFSAILDYIENKSYNYAFIKTKNPIVANEVKKEITNDLLNKLNSANNSLSCYLGKDRNKKVNKIIKKIRNKEQRCKQHLFQTKNDCYPLGIQITPPPFDIAPSNGWSQVVPPPFDYTPIPSQPAWNPGYVDNPNYIPSYQEWEPCLNPYKDTTYVVEPSAPPFDFEVNSFADDPNIPSAPEWEI